MPGISDIRVWPIKNPKGKMIASGDFLYDSTFKMRFRLFTGPNGPFLGFPGKFSEKKDEKTGEPIFYPDIVCTSKDLKNDLNEQAVAVYNNITGNTNAQEEAVSEPMDQTTEKRNIPF